MGSTPAWTSTHTYLNAETNPQSSTVHLGARDYDPTLGRFLTADPILDPKDPLQDNGYVYSHHDPVGTSDPTGLHQECEGPCHGADNSAGSTRPKGTLGSSSISASGSTGAGRNPVKSSQNCWGPGGENLCGAPSGATSSSAELQTILNGFISALGGPPGTVGSGPGLPPGLTPNSVTLNDMP